MTRINLLDWRQERRNLRRQQFFIMLGLGFVASAVIALLGLFFASEAVDHQRERNQYLRQQIAETEQKIKEIQDLERTKANLLARMRVIEALQASRSATVHFFDEIINTLPDGVFITGLKQQGNMITIDGVAESNGRISTYMKNLDASQWFAEPKLVVIKTYQRERQRKGDFTLQVKNLTKAIKKDQAAEDGK